MRFQLVVVAVVLVAACAVDMAEPLLRARQALADGGGDPGCVEQVCIPSTDENTQWGIDSDEVTFPAGFTDHLLRLGWNVGDNGVQLNPDEHALYLLFESHYSPAPGTNWTEWHVHYRNGAAARAPLTLIVNTDTHLSEVGVKGKFNVFNSDGTKVRVQLWDNGPGTQVPLYYYDVLPTWDKPDIPMARAHVPGQPGSGIVEALRVRASGRVTLAATGHTTRAEGPFEVYPAGVGRLRVDATGVGFYGAEPIARPVVNGSCESIAAALDALGLVDYQP